MTGETLRQFAASDRPTLATAFHNMLVEFGYPSLTKATVTEHIGAFMDGDPLPEQDVIAMFIYGWLENGIEEE